LSRIELNIVATGNFRSVETSIAKLRSQVDGLNASMTGLKFNAGIGKSVSLFQDQFNSAIDSSGMFERHMVNLTTETTKFGRGLESGSLKIGQLFRAASEYRRGELGQIRQLAKEQVRIMNSTTMRMPDGGTQVIVPRGIDMGIEKQRLLNQEFRIFRQVVQNGSTEIINWGKNTQWAGRQLTVGLTVPLTIFGAAAGKMFMDADKQLVRLAKVYGDATKGMVSSTDLTLIKEQTLSLGQELAGALGIAASETIGIAADIAATGKEGKDLLDSTREAIRLSVLGEVDRQEAMRATISIQNVFKKDAQGLAEAINFLNAVENQSSTTLDDLVTGIVKAGPVVQGLGGEIKDLAMMMVAMREGGIPASEAANAIKSSLASLINPTKETRNVMNGFGIDLVGIVDKNAGDVIGTLTQLQSELEVLNDLSRQRAIEQIFGKFQFSRINAMLSNIGRAGSQTEQVLAIAGMSAADLAKNAEEELTTMTESVSGKFQRSFEALKASLIPIGETFISVGTILINVGNKVLEIFNSIPEPIKNIVKGILGLTAAAGPIIMITGVLGNFFGYLVKGISTILAFKKEGRGAFELLSVDSIAARDSTELLSESLYDQSTAMNTMSQAVDTLVKKLQELVNQLNHARSASGGLDQAAQGVMANAEAAAVVRMRPSAPYTTPNIPWQFSKEKGRSRYTGRESVGATYSHLTPASMLGKGEILGMGSFVDEAGSDVQKRLKNFYADLLSIREDVVDSVFRREMLEDIAMLHHTAGPEFDATVSKIRSLTDEQLAQLLPTWEKLTAQSTEYFSIISVASEQAAAGVTTAKEAFERYGEDISQGAISPEDALQKLRNSINGVDGAVDKRAEEINNLFKEIEQEISSMPAGRDRSVALITRVKEKIIDPYEVESLRRNSELGRNDPARIIGLGSEGLRSPLLYAIQKYTDQIFNNIQSSQQLIDAANEVNEAMSRYQIALSNAEYALDQSDNASKELQQAEIEAAAALKKAYPSSYKNMDIASAIIRQPEPTEEGPSAGVAKWFVDDREVKNQSLIDALNRRELALNAVSEADLQLALTSENLEQSETALAQKTVELTNQKEIEKQLAVELSTGNQELIDSTRRLAELRNSESRAIAERAAAEEQYEIAAKEEAEARIALAMAEKERAKELLKGVTDSQTSSAENAARQRLLQAELNLAQASERRKAAIINGTRATNELSEEELQLSILREKQSIEVIENTASTQRNTNSTDEGTMVREGHTGAIVGNKGATERDSKGILRGGKLGSMISMASMVAMFLPRPGEDTGAGQAMNAGINIANMTGMGAMFGGPGIAIGASLGLAVEGIKFLGRKSEEAAIELEKIRASSLALKSGLTELERSFFQADPLKDLGDTALNAFRLKTEEATSRLKEFARAVKEAEQGSPEAGRRDAISQMSNAEEFINDPMFAKMVSQALLGGMDVEDIKIMIGGYLDAADKEVFAPLVNEEITRIGKLGKKPEEIGARYIADLQNIANRVISGAGYSDYQESGLRSAQMQYENARRNRSVQAIDPETKEFVDANTADMAIYFQDIAKQFGMSVQQLLILLQQELASPTEPGAMNPAVEKAMRGITLDGISTGEDFRKFISDIAPALQQLVAISPDLVNIKDVMGAIGNEAQLFADGITNALGSGRENFDEFLNSLGNTAESMNENAQLASEMGARIGQISPSAKTAFEVMVGNGVELQDALRIISMLISDAGTDWAQLADLAIQNPVNFRMKIWTEYVSGGSSLPGSVPAQGASSPEGIVSRLAGAIDYSSGGSGGSGGSGSDYYDKLIEAQDKIIQGIKEEREERQKLLDLQQKQLDFALRRQDLENQIARALAEGNFAEAALLQAQLDSEKKKYQAQELERKRQEQEDRRIEKAEKEKERLQKLKEASSGGGSGGGGGSSGPSEFQKQWTANRIEILSSGVVNWTEGAELRARTGQMGPWSAFFESDKVKGYREELIKLGVPIEYINKELNTMFDSWIDNNSALFAQTDDYKFIQDSLRGMGVEGEALAQIMPDAFGILLDKELNPKEKIDLIAGAIYDLGYETDEAYRKAKKLYDKYGEDFDSKGIDEEIERWLELNNRIQNAKKQLKQYQEGSVSVTADQVDRTALAAEGLFPGVKSPNTINAGGVQIDAEKTGVNMLGSVVLGWESEKENAKGTIQAIAKYLQEAFKDANEMRSPSRVYERYGISIIEGLIKGLILPPDSLNKIVSSMNDTFKSAVDSYKVLFTDPSSGIDGVMHEEVKTASENFYNTMTEKMRDTTDEINKILKTNLTDYTFQIIGNPKIYDGGARSIWQRVFEGIPDSMFTSEMPKYATGGYVSGPGGPTDDKIPALLSDGEYVIKASSVDKYGTGLLDLINARRFANGGRVSADRAEYNASRRPTYFGGTPTSSTGYNKPAPSYYGGTPTYSGGYTSASTYRPKPAPSSTPAQTGPADELNIAYTGSGLISLAGGNYAWDTAKGKYVKLADIRTGSALSGFSLMYQGMQETINQHGILGTLLGVGKNLIASPQQILPFVGSADIDTTTEGGKDLYAASTLLDFLSVIPGMAGVSMIGRSSTNAARSLAAIERVAKDGIPSVVDYTNQNQQFNSSDSIGGTAYERILQNILGPNSTPSSYTRPVLRPTAQQIWQAKRNGMYGLTNVPQVPYAFDPTRPESSLAALPFGMPTPPRFGVVPRRDTPRPHEDPTNYGKNSAVMNGYADAWATYVAMSSAQGVNPNDPTPAIRSGPGMNSVSDIFPEYHTMGPAKARGFNYGLIKIFGNLENAIRWGIKPMAVDPNPTLKEVPLDTATSHLVDSAIARGLINPNDPDARRRISILQYEDPSKNIDAEIYPSNWNQMSLQEKLMYKTGRVLGYNQGLGYSTEISLQDIPEFGRVPSVIESMIREEGTTPMGLASKYASKKAPEFTYNKAPGIQNDFAIYQDSTGKVWSTSEILGGRTQFAPPIYPEPPGVEELNSFQTAIQSAVDVASMSTGVPDIIAKSILRGASGAIFNQPEGQGFRNAMAQFASGKMNLSTAIIMGTMSTINPNWSETEIMKPSNWAKWSSAPIGSDEWFGMHEYFTNQRDSQGRLVPNTTSRPGIPIGGPTTHIPRPRTNAPTGPGFPSWGTGAPRTNAPTGPGFPSWGTGKPRVNITRVPPGFPSWGTGAPRTNAPTGPGFPSWGTGAPRKSTAVALPVPSRSPSSTSSPITGTGQAAMTPRLYSAYLRSLRQGVVGYVPPLINPFTSSGFLNISQDAVSELPEGITKNDLHRVLGSMYSPEDIEVMYDTKLDPANRNTVLNMIKLSRMNLDLLGSGEYEALAKKMGLHPRSIGVYETSSNSINMRPITRGDNPYNLEQTYRTIFHEISHGISTNLGIRSANELYSDANQNVKFDETFKGIPYDPNSIFGIRPGVSFGHGIEEASAVLSEHIMMKRKMGSKYSITDKGTDNVLYAPGDLASELPFNILNGQLSYNAMYYLSQKNKKTSPLSSDEMKYLVGAAAEQFVNQMGGRIDIPPGLNPLELAYMYAPTSLQKIMSKNGHPRSAWTGAKGGMVKKMREGGLVRVGKENLTVLGEGISDYAKRFVGTPYSSSAAWADGPANGWGCATATKWLYDSYAGIDPGHPSLSAAQYASGSGSRVNDMLPGDLLFFYYPNGVNTGNPINHVGMAVGNGQMFHAQNPAQGTGVTGIDGAGMERARARAGGSAMKRYLPMTIAGMGLPKAQFKMGGKVYGKGGPTSDEILALISNGEYVMNANAVTHYGKDFMDAVNKGILPEAATGGMFSSKYPGYVQKMGSEGMLSRKFGKEDISSSISNVEYNINVNVSGTNSSPDDIAEAVMKSIKRKERMVGAVTKI